MMLLIKHKSKFTEWSKGLLKLFRLQTQIHQNCLERANLIVTLFLIALYCNFLLVYLILGELFVYSKLFVFFYDQLVTRKYPKISVIKVNELLFPFSVL